MPSKWVTWTSSYPCLGGLCSLGLVIMLRKQGSLDGKIPLAHCHNLWLSFFFIAWAGQCVCWVLVHGAVDEGAGVYLRTSRIRLPSLVISHTHLLWPSPVLRYVSLDFPSQQGDDGCSGKSPKLCWLMRCSCSQWPVSDVTGQGLWASSASASTHLWFAGTSLTSSVSTPSSIVTLFFWDPPFLLGLPATCFPNLNSLWTKAQGMTSLLISGSVPYLLIGGMWHFHLDRAFSKSTISPNWLQLASSKLLLKSSKVPFQTFICTHAQNYLPHVTTHNLRFFFSYHSPLSLQAWFSPPFSLSLQFSLSKLIYWDILLWCKFFWITWQWWHSII